MGEMTADEHKGSRRSSGRKIGLFALKFGVSIFVLWIVFRFLGSPETAQRLLAADRMWIVAGALCIALVQVVKALRFVELAAVTGMKIPYFRSLNAHLIVPILGMITPGKLGEGAKIVYLRESKKELGFLFIIERIQDLLMLLFVAGFGFAFSDFYIVSYLVMAGIVGIGIMVFLKLEWFVNAVTKRLFKKEYFTENWFLERSAKLLSPRILAPLILTVVVWGITFASSLCFARSVGIQLPYPKIALVFSWGVILGLLSSLPGGVGVREGSITVLLSRLYAVPNAQGAAVAAINLGVHYLVLALLAGIGYSLAGLRREHS